MCNSSNNLNNSNNSMQDSGSIITLGIHHLGLSVPNIKQTADFFIEQLNFNKVGEKPEYPAIFVSDGTVMLTLWQIQDSAKQVAFDRKHNVGLHHFALKVSSLVQLKSLHTKLIELNTVEVEFAPEPLGDSPLHHMMCVIPGGIRLELICE